MRERLMLWQEVRNGSLEDERARLQAEEQEELTFKPQVRFNSILIRFNSTLMRH